MLEVIWKKYGVRIFREVLIKFREVQHLPDARWLHPCDLSLRVPSQYKDADRLIFNMGISIPEKDGLYIETGSRSPRCVVYTTFFHPESEAAIATLQEIHDIDIVVYVHQWCEFALMKAKMTPFVYRVIYSITLVNRLYFGDNDFLYLSVKYQFGWNIQRWVSVKVTTLVACTVKSLNLHQGLIVNSTGFDLRPVT